MHQPLCGGFIQLGTFNEMQMCPSCQEDIYDL